MSPLRIASVLLVLGGLTWAGRMGVDIAGGDPDSGLGTVLLWAGAVLLTLGTALAAFSSVDHAPLWLQVIVAFGAPVALWMVLLAGNDMAGSANAEAAGGFGLLLAIVAGTVFVRVRPETKHRGARAAH
jgi:hypothetical protein